MGADTESSDRQRKLFRASTDSPRAARQFVVSVLSRSAPAQVTRDLTLVVSELVTNFVEHSGGPAVEVAFVLADPHWWQVEVIGGTGLASKRVPEPETWTLAAAEEISGRGLGIVRQLMDHVVIDVADDRVSVRCRRRRM